MFNWLWKSANRKNRPQARKNRRQPSRLPLRLERLEDRTLLSFSTPILASVSTAGNAAGNDFSVTNDNNRRVLSADGTLEVFASSANNLTGVSDSNGTLDVFVRNLATGVTTLVSSNAAGTAAGNASSDSPVISADGHFVAFRSFSTDLVGAPTGGRGDIFLRDLVAGTTTLVSVNSSGNAGGNDTSEEPDLSDDGNIIAYRSFATDLVGGFLDANSSGGDVFARNRTTNTTLLVSVNTGNGSTGGNNDSDLPLVSGDGSRVVFQSLATDLVAGLIDANFSADLFVRTLGTNTTDAISVETSAPATANNFSFLTTSSVTNRALRSLSADGRFEVFSSVATDLVGTPAGGGGVFVRDRQTGTVTLVSINAAGTAGGNATSDSPVISADGRFVVFRSFATDLVSTPTNSQGNIFVRDLVAGTTTLVSVNSAGSDGGNGASGDADISADGRRIVFQSFATDLVGTPTGGVGNVFLRDLGAGTTTLISVNSSGSDGGNFFSGLPAISGDGTHVAFQSFATDLVAGVADTNGTGDLFVRTVGGSTRLVSINSGHTATGNGRSDSQVLSADGKLIAFESDASNLVSGDTNFNSDVFVFDETANAGAGAITLVSVNGSGTVGNGSSGQPSISSDGNRIAFQSFASNLAAPDSNTTGDIFVRDRAAGTTTLVSINAAGTNSGDQFSTVPVISGNGQVVVFATKSTNLVTGISGLTGTRSHLYARNLAAGTTVLVSINPAGTASGNRQSSRADVSSDGRVVTFDSDATNLVAGDANQETDIFARNLVANNGQAANTTEAVSVKGPGLFTGLGGADQPALSFSGQFVAFSSTAINLTTDDTNGRAREVFLRDVAAGTTVLVSVSSAGVASNDTSDEPSISSDGNRIAFLSVAHLAAPDSNTGGDIFVRDRAAGTTTLVSINAAGTDGGDAESDVPVISGNGQVVAFRSHATNLVSGISGLDGNFTDLYARNLATGETNLLSVNATGDASGNSNSNAARLSADGKTATFESNASNLVPIDGNGTEDVFVNRRIGVSINGLSQREGDSGTTAYGFTVTLSAPSMQTVTVHFATADGTATTANNDYQATSGDLTFDPGVTSKTVTVPVNGDTTPEPDESFSVNLSSASNAELFVSSVQGTILNDDATISIDDVTKVEGDSGTTDAVFTVRIPFASALAVSVHFATADSTATTANNDYQATSGDLTFDPGDTSKTITLTISGDTTPEPDEIFFVNLSNPVNAQFTDGQGAGTIRNDDAALSINDVTRAEGNASTTPVSFTVSIPFASVNTVTVHFATADGTATAADNDYQPTSGDLTFMPGATTQSVTVQVNGDTKNEADETFTVNLSAPTNASLSDGQGQGTIQNDDPPPSLSINSVSAAEGDGGTTNFNFTVSLSAVSGQQVTVHFATADSTATTADGDYTTASGDLAFAPGQTTKTVTVLVNGDTTNEADETFTVNLSAPTNATIGTGTGTGTIQNDDPQPSLSINDVSQNEGNSGTTSFNFTVTLSAASGQPVTVRFAASDGSATTADNDYQAASGNLTFAPGQTTKTVTVLVNGDATNEPDETFFVNLASPTNATISDGQGQGTILNDDVAAPATHFSITAPGAAAPGIPFNFTVTALDASNNTATGYSGTAHFTSSDGAAGLPADTTLTNGTATFSATLNTSGSQTITTTDTTNSSITGTSNPIDVTASAATHFVVSAPSSATAGSAFSFTVTAQDQFNNTATGYTGTVHFTSSDGQAILPANSTLTNGVGTFNATLETAGTQTLTATDTASTSITGTSNTIAVSPAAATHFTVSAPSSATAGNAFNVTVTALDPFNNTATGYTGTAHFTSSDGQVVLPANSTLTNGAGTFSATLKTPGSQTITATDTANSALTDTSNAIAVSPAAATHFTVSAPGGATAGSAFNFTVTALDAFNNTSTGYTGTVHFTSSDGQAVLPGNSTLTNGVGTFGATLKTAGSQTITATDIANSALTGTSNTITVTPAAATHFTVSAPGSATAGSAFNFTVTAQDPFNNTATGYTGTVHFTSSDGQAVVSANSILTGGTGTFSATLKTAGSQTLTATDTLTSSLTGTSNSIAVSATAATHFSVSAPGSATAGNAFNFSVTAQDAFNNTATSYAGTVHFTSSDGAASLPGNSTLSNGTGTFSATFATAGSQMLTATDTVTGSITGTGNATSVGAAAATHFAVSAPDSTPAGTAFNFTVTARDPFGNTATGYTGTVHFTSSDGLAVVPADGMLTNGTDSFTATLNTSGNQTLTAADTVSNSITGTSNAVVVTATTAVRPEIQFVTALYRALLSRDPEPFGLGIWVGLLDGGGTRVQVAQGIYISPEHRGRQVDQFYATFLHRAAESGGRDFWVNALLRGVSETDVARAFLLSQEYTSSHPDTASFVNGLYGDVLGREPDSQGESFWRGLVADGGAATRALAADGFLTSREAHLGLLDRFYRDYLHRPADAPGETGWLRVLDQGLAPPALVEQAFLVSEEFFSQATRGGS
jgi:Calx-beta domain/Domain of unknown function (DUF4214)/WD40-like Beta Propeller Repeat